MAVLFFIWFLFASPYFLRGLIPFPSDYLVSFFPPWNAAYGMPVKNSAMPDVISQIMPWKMLTVSAWRQGQVPLWNPYSFSGTVHAANYQSAVFTPFNLIFFILPFVDAWSLLILLQPLLAGLFMYLYIRKIGVSRPGGLVASLAFMFCGFLTVWMAYGTLGYAALWLPLALYMAERFRDGWPYAGAGIAAAVALSFLSGHFQISLYVAGAVILYAVFLAFSDRRFRGRRLAGLLLAVGAGIAAAAVQLLPSFNAYLASSRKTSFVKGEIIPWQYIVTLLAPDFYGNPVTRNDWFGHYAEWNGFVGVVPFLLALFATVSKNTRKRFFYVLGILALLLSYRTPLTDLMFTLRIPVVSTSAASRIIVLFSFSAAALAGLGTDAVGNYVRSIRVRTLLLISGGILLLPAAAWVMTAVSGWFPSGMAAVARHNLILPTVLTLTFLVLIAGFRTRHRIAIVIPILFVVLTGADGYRFAAKWMPFSPREFVYPPMPVLEFLTDHAGNNRVFGNLGSEVGNVFRLQMIEGYDAMYANRYGQFMHAESQGSPIDGDRSVVQFDKHGTYALDTLQLLGVRYVVHRKSDGRNVWTFPYWEYPESFRQVYADDAYWVYEYTDAYPRAFLASSYIKTADAETTIRQLFSPATDRRDTLILPSDPDIRPQAGTGSASIVSYTGDTVVVKTDSDGPKLLFLSDAYDPGWHATVDGGKVPVLRADYDFRAVAVPEGTHTVRFTYRPAAFAAGSAVSVASVLLILLSGIRQAMMGRTEGKKSHRNRQRTGADR